MSTSEYKLLPSDSPLLQERCREVGMDDDISGLLAALKSICEQECGLGLAANQIGSNLRVFVLNFKGMRVYANPEILEQEGEFIFDGEGCLSFPGEIYCTRRFNRIKICSDSGPDEILTGIEAVAFQHELDHLDGITMHKRRV